MAGFALAECDGCVYSRHLLSCSMQRTRVRASSFFFTSIVDSKDRGMIYHDPAYTVIHRLGVFSSFQPLQQIRCPLSLACT